MSLQVVVVQAISALCQKYPRKHSVMMTFLSNMLRDDVRGALALGRGFGRILVGLDLLGHEKGLFCQWVHREVGLSDCSSWWVRPV